MQLVLDTYGLLVSVRNRCFHIKSQAAERIISPARITSILVSKNCRISSKALLLAAQHEIPVLFADRGGKVGARIWSGNYSNTTGLRRRQVFFHQKDECTGYIVQVLEFKAESQIKHLDNLSSLLPAEKPNLTAGISRIAETAKDLRQARGTITESAPLLRAVEAQYTKIYWQTLKASLPKHASFNGRSKRPALDTFNALLNYNYGLLYGLVETSLLSVGLDVHMGFLHADGYNKKTLVFDFIEPFRAWGDEMLTTMCIKQILRSDWFEEKAGEWWLTQTGRRSLITAFNAHWRQRIKFNNQVTTRQNHVLRMAAALVKLINEAFSV